MKKQSTTANIRLNCSSSCSPITKTILSHAESTCPLQLSLRDWSTGWGVTGQKGGFTSQKGGVHWSKGWVTGQRGGATGQMGGVTGQKGGVTGQKGGVTGQKGGGTGQTAFFSHCTASWNNRRAQEMCERRGGRPGPPVPNKSYGLRGRKATLVLNYHYTQSSGDV